MSNDEQGSLDDLLNNMDMEAPPDLELEPERKEATKPKRSNMFIPKSFFDDAETANARFTPENLKKIVNRDTIDLYESLFNLGIKMQIGFAAEKNARCKSCKDRHVFQVRVYRGISAANKESEDYYGNDESDKKSKKGKAKTEPKKKKYQAGVYTLDARCDCEGGRKSSYFMQFKSLDWYAKYEKLMCADCGVFIKVDSIDQLKIMHNRILCWQCYRENQNFNFDQALKNLGDRIQEIKIKRSMQENEPVISDTLFKMLFTQEGGDNDEGNDL